MSLRDSFPQGYVHHVSDPSYRALIHKYGGTTTNGMKQLTLFGNSVKAWDTISMKKASSEFEVPVGTKILIINPDVFDRDILINYPEFRFEHKDSSTGKKSIGIKTPCPWCKSNEFVKLNDATGYRINGTRTVAGCKEMMPMISIIGECSNPTCGGSRARDSSDNCGVHQFTLSDVKTWNNYPLELRRRYGKMIHREVADGKDGEMFVSGQSCMDFRAHTRNAQKSRFFSLLRHFFLLFHPFFLTFC